MEIPGGCEEPAVPFFDYNLPAERIAQRPIGSNRAHSKLLVSAGGCLLDDRFSSLPHHLGAGDLLVLNNTTVSPARFFGRKEGTDREIELLLIASPASSEKTWRALARPMRHLKAGDRVTLGDEFAAEVLGREGDELFVRFAGPETLLDRYGSMPIPPYIRNGRGDTLDRETYQTCFAAPQNGWGSVAAPTASLHFTPELLEELCARGVEIVFVTLQLGPASFLPVRKGCDISEYRLEPERRFVPRASWGRVLAARAAGRRVVAVGTTCVRTLESAFLDIEEHGAETVLDRWMPADLFIRPGFSFNVVDLLITNFHQPRSTHLLLVSAFAGEERVRSLYEHALGGSYRFLSYGDAMLLDRSRS